MIRELRVNDVVLNDDRKETIINIRKEGSIVRYLTVDEDNRKNMFTNKDLCEESIRDKRIKVCK